jgi:hypothetical protein
MQDIGSILGYFSGGVSVGLALFAILGRKYLESYLTEKGKNLATKEDIKDITHQVEAIKNQYAQLLEEQKARNQLRLAAIDRRLQAHQEAYSLWRKLIAYVHSDENSGVVMECQTWWSQNCLYLGAQARAAFRDGYEAAYNHPALVKDHSNASLVKENWKILIRAGPKIVEAAELPSLGETEAKLVDNSANP